MIQEIFEMLVNFDKIFEKFEKKEVWVYDNYLDYLLKIL